MLTQTKGIQQKYAERKMPSGSRRISSDGRMMEEKDEGEVNGSVSGGAAPEEESGWVELSSPSACGRGSDDPLGTWSLVLESRGIPFALRVAGPKRKILVPAEEWLRAQWEIRCFEEENRGWPPPAAVETPLAENTLTSLAVVGLVALFHNLTMMGFLGLGHDGWIAAGGAQAGRIVSGEWWRAVTALTLHADGQHLLGNVLIGGFFIVRLCRVLGSAAGWFLLLASGTAGNLINALLHPPSYLSVGASTAVFGAVGLLAALSVHRHRGSLLKRWPVPLAAGAALLAMLGTSGERTDLGGHLFGFFVGMALGLSARFWESAFERGEIRFAAGAVAALLPLLAWAAALSAA